MLAHAKELKGDPKKIALVGESAGGNMAATVSVMAREHKMEMPIYQVLVYPIADNNVETASYVETPKQNRSIALACNGSLKTTLILYRWQ